MKTLLLPDYLTIIGISSLAGMRTMAAPMVLSHFITRYERALDGTANETDIKVDRNMKYMALAEMVADKIPFIPNRTAVPSLVGRSISGALTGAAVSKRTGARSMVPGIVAGALSAVAITYISFYIRKRLRKHTRIPDAALGLLEDMLILKAGAWWLRKARRDK